MVLDEVVWVEGAKQDNVPEEVHVEVVLGDRRAHRDLNVHVLEAVPEGSHKTTF